MILFLPMYAAERAASSGRAILAQVVQHTQPLAILAYLNHLKVSLIHFNLNKATPPGYAVWGMCVSQGQQTIQYQPPHETTYSHNKKITPASTIIPLTSWLTAGTDLPLKIKILHRPVRYKKNCGLSLKKILIHHGCIAPRRCVWGAYVRHSHA